MRTEGFRAPGKTTSTMTTPSSQATVCTKAVRKTWNPVCRPLARFSSQTAIAKMGLK